MIERIFYSLRYAFRSLIKKPAFSVIACLTLALALGANTAIFSLVEHFLLRPLPFADADHLVLLHGTDRVRPGRLLLSFPDYFDFKVQTKTMEQLGAFLDQWSCIWAAPEAAQRLNGAIVTKNFFAVLGVKPLIGTAFPKQEATENAPRMVILSYALWRDSFSSDLKVIGKTIRLDGELCMITGVAPPGFDFPQQSRIWMVSHERNDPTTRGSHFLTGIGRLKPGVSLQQAGMEMNTIATRLAQSYPETDHGRGIVLSPLPGFLVENVRPSLLVLTGAVALVLLIACANVAGLLMARAKSRQKEIAIRLALGASRKQIIFQLWTESLILAIGAGLLGLIIAWWSIELIPRLSPVNFIGIADVKINAAVFLYGLLLSVLTSVVFGLAPAWSASRSELNDSMKSSSGTRTSVRGRGALVATQVMLALVLLIVSALLLKSFLKLRKVDPGFQYSHLQTFNLVLPPDRYDSDPKVLNYFQNLMDRIGHLPGVTSVAGTSSLPFTTEGDTFAKFTIQGRTYTPGTSPAARVTAITPNYFETMGIPLLNGRLFSNRDLPNTTAVAIVNQEFVRQNFPDEDPIGKIIVYGVTFGATDARPATIVGITSDIKRNGLHQGAESEMFIPEAQNTSTELSLLVRTTGEPAQYAGTFRSLVGQIDRGVPVANMTSMDAMVEGVVSPWRFYASIVLIFAGLAVVMAMIGIYGLMSFVVSQGVREIGIRMALGARSRDVLQMILHRGALLAGGGVLVGLVVALTCAPALSSLLFHVTPFDPSTYLLVALLFFVVALSASYFPARRATRVDPITVLRYE